jgi:hypothetical protein
MMHARVLFVIFFFVTSAAFAAEPARTRQLASHAQSPPATIADISWLQGHWTGKALGGETEEMWMPPKGGVMLGMYRLIKDGKPVFYELLTFAEERGSLVLRLKHFEPDLTGWEEKAESRRFALVAKEPGAVYLEGMTFIRNRDDSITVYVAVDRNGTISEERFDYRRASATPR